MNVCVCGGGGGGRAGTRQPCIQRRRSRLDWLGWLWGGGGVGGREGQVIRGTGRDG